MYTLRCCISTVPKRKIFLHPPKMYTKMSIQVPSPTAYSLFPSNTQFVRTLNSSSFSVPSFKSTNNHGRIAVGVFLQKKTKKLVGSRQGFRCNCSSSSTPGGPAPGENESKQVLDAFFLGKALAETINERIESTLGEFLSTVGRLQAEQQKQVQEFQDEVLERAKKAKAKAAREAMEAQGLVPKSTTPVGSSPTTNEPETASAAVDEPTTFASSSSSGSEDQSPDNGSTDPPLGISIE